MNRDSYYNRDKSKGCKATFWTLMGIIALITIAAIYFTSCKHEYMDTIELKDIDRDIIEQTNRTIKELEKMNHSLRITIDVYQEYFTAAQSVLEEKQSINDQRVPFFVYDIYCPECNHVVYLHQAINDIEHPAYIVDCVHSPCTPLSTRWASTKQQAIDDYKNALKIYRCK